MSEILTGEAVLLELRPASFAARSLGSAIDVLATVLLAIGALIAFSAIPFLVDLAAAKAIILALALALVVGLPIAVETLSRGRSLGKLVMGLRVVRDDGGSIRFRHALIRSLLGVLELYMSIGSVAFLVSLFNEKSKRLGDMLAGTYAIRVRVPKTVPLQVHTVEALAPWAQLADIGRLPDPLVRRISLFLGQGRHMAAGSRAALGAALASEALLHVSPAPPHGTSPEIFLAALISEHRERDFVRMSAQARRAAVLRDRISCHGVAK
ncbi:RDD family protein [Arthrobacter cryoconiti]|uniref:RDD family protein n=1 Tax=Arthrobacter cryoconiti TaxID=748907 RepID=A0ABV8R4A5_9MICC|nr:RDD family protein [Arthrobacter cryoconiti]MCC9066986.1 RDD family protein [Arthrobacter cryoconiti]